MKETLERARSRLGESARYREGAALLEVPDEVSRDLTHFTTDPRSLLQHRNRIARAIEQLQAD